jgi:aspartate/methionine/tyrosine aminotransferase
VATIFVRRIAAGAIPAKISCTPYDPGQMVERLAPIPGFAIDRVAAAAGDDPSVLRLENLDTDVPPPAVAVEATRVALGRDEANSYLPFTGSLELRAAIALHVGRLAELTYSAADVVVTCGGTEGLIDALLATVDPGDEVILTDPTYAGMTNRVRLAGAVPRLVPFRAEAGEWRLDLDALAAAVGPRTRALMIMSPSMPSGAVLTRAEWDALADVVCARDAWLIYNAAMERILFDGRPYVHPATLGRIAERTLTVGSVSKEYRMIGWRIGWVVGPSAMIADVARAHVYNVVTPTGIGQAGALAALTAEDGGGVEQAVAEWQRRRDAVVAELDGLPVVPAAGGWSLLLDVGELGHDSETASDLLLERGRVAATPMRHWGEVNGDRFVRFVFSNEPVERLRGLGDRVRRSLV